MLPWSMIIVPDVQPYWVPYQSNSTITINILLNNATVSYPRSQRRTNKNIFLSHSTKEFEWNQVRCKIKIIKNGNTEKIAPLAEVSRYSQKSKICSTYFLLRNTGQIGTHVLKFPWLRNRKQKWGVEFVSLVPRTGSNPTTRPVSSSRGKGMKYLAGAVRPTTS